MQRINVVGRCALVWIYMPSQWPDNPFIGKLPLGCVVKSRDVSFLMMHLHQYAYKWRDIGTALNFQHSELENISHGFPRATIQQLLTELLSQWSQWPTADHSDVPTMERLRDALRSGLVGLGAQANDLYELRSQLPSQANRYNLLHVCV